ncbi:hypothetical protein [Lacinutrix sp. 5H-3-7-4]|uniref:hypothetical protein n=1 Tax=Lacinutrix sp. (strain 5H-3-7-4) TaxID=983544 RepID=UPI00020A36EC|nr:hypothetical protein [Lacinutrix sp. 5H-3-7-4]AEH00293.1 hypothetical protein Lacal_0441 [Lacinutrix sp. 5H-3-7-4]
MDNILFFKLITTIIPLIFIIGGIYLAITEWKNKIYVIICCIVILIGGINLKDSLFDSPNLTESKIYHNKFKELIASDIEKIIVKSEFISREYEIKSKEITDKNHIKKILEFMKFNQSKTFEFKDWSPESCYNLECITYKNEIFKFHICESEDNRSYIDILYSKNENFIKIGQYRNDFIKELKILDFK